MRAGMVERKGRGEWAKAVERRRADRDERAGNVEEQGCGAWTCMNDIWWRWRRSWCWE